MDCPLQAPEFRVQNTWLDEKVTSAYRPESNVVCILQRKLRGIPLQADDWLMIISKEYYALVLVWHSWNQHNGLNWN